MSLGEALNVSLLPEGIEIHNNGVRVKDEIETFIVFDRKNENRFERVEFTWTPYRTVEYIRRGFLRHEPYRSYDYLALDLHRQELGVAAIRRLLSKRLSA